MDNNTLRIAIIAIFLVLMTMTMTCSYAPNCKPHAAQAANAFIVEVT